MKKYTYTVLFDANSLMTQRTGVGFYTAGLVEAMAKLRPDIRFVGYYYNFLGRKQPPASPVADNLSYRPIYHLPGPIVNLLRRAGIEVPIELITMLRADFVLYPNYLSQPSLFGAANAPVIHDLVYFDHPEYGSDKSVRDLTRFVPRSLSRASFIIAVSNFTKERITTVYPDAKQTIITTFIPPAAVRTVPQATAQELVSKLGVDKSYILFIGTMEPRKNLVRLMEAYAQLPEAIRSKHSLVLAGKLDWKFEETKAKLEELQAAGHDIRYLGYVDDDTRAALYQQARLFAMSPHYEGFGMQTLEAMQYGIPCALSDIPVLREVGGDMAAYFNQEDVASITNTLATCLTGSSPEPQKLKDYVAGQPDWQQVSQTVVDQIEQTLKAKGKAA